MESGRQGRIDVRLRRVADHPGVRLIETVACGEFTVGRFVLFGQNFHG